VEEEETEEVVEGEEVGSVTEEEIDLAGKRIVIEDSRGRGPSVPLLGEMLGVRCREEMSLILVEGGMREGSPMSMMTEERSMGVTGTPTEEVSHLVIGGSPTGETLMRSLGEDLLPPVRGIPLMEGGRSLGDQVRGGRVMEGGSQRKGRVMVIRMMVGGSRRGGRVMGGAEAVGGRRGRTLMGRVEVVRGSTVEVGWESREVMLT